MSRAIILMYHQVDIPISDKERRFCVHPDDFGRQINWLIRSGYKFVSLNDIIEHVSGSEILPKKTVHITFDDGFIGTFEHAWPVLKKNNIPATLFAVSGLLGDSNRWMWQRGFPKRAIISKHHLRELSQEGMCIGSHTCTHPRLTEITSQEITEELQKSKKELEDIIGKKVNNFAYPYGLFNKTIQNLVEKSGYQSACSTRSGFNRPGEDPLLLRRIDVFGTDRLWQFRQKLTFGVNQSGYFQPLLYYAKRIVNRITPAR